MAKKENMTYEAAKKRLDQILQDLDSGKTGIDELEQILSEAKELIEFSMKRLETAEKIIIKWEK